MHSMGLNEIREKYLSYFETKGHLRLPSYPLVPINDKSLLLINSGMAPMKKFFTGEEEPPRRRVTTCQKCIRTPDLERVGKTARHGTYFEMLGNFSFGDYFKEEAIAFSWEFLTKVLEIPENLLWPSIYEGDEEAYHIWKDQIGVPEEHIVRLGKADNFWEHGSGPCGPCSEIYFDRGEKYGCGSPDCKPGCECDRYMEIWNNVFSQFNNDGKGNYTELAQKNIDTGMGLERLACVMQGVDNMFEVDTIRNILNTVCRISGKNYGDDADDDVSIRIITDHVRSASFMICDGVLPSNEGRGYVLRRIIRRAARHGRLLGIEGSFLGGELCDIVIRDNEGAYPELKDKAAFIKKVLSLEEERFDATIDQGLSILSEMTAAAKEKGEKTLCGADVFKLYDTYGFPIDLTREIASEQGLDVDEEGFDALMLEQKTRARAARANISGWSDATKSAITALPKTEFLGYTEESCQGKILAIFVDDEAVETVSEGDCTLVLDRTVFYGEGGGQVGDTGTVALNGAVVADVTDTKKTEGVYLHLCTLTDGALSVGDSVSVAIQPFRRAAIRRDHSSAHLLQSALRKVLGDHVAQAGSYVDEHRMRFDFTHFAAMTPEEIKQTEVIVNQYIFSALPVTATVMSIEDARKSGAIALFGEKYGKEVRVVKMGDISTEFCAGTHVDNTSNIGMFHILSESGISAGVRRIEAVTGLNVLDLLVEKESVISRSAAALKGNAADLEGRCESVMNELKSAQKQIAELTEKQASAFADSLLAKAEDVNGTPFVCCTVDGDAAFLRTVADQMRAKNPDAVILLSATTDGKVMFASACGVNAVKKGNHAGNLVKKAATLCGGGGGGRPDCAAAGGRDASHLAEVPAAVRELVK
ncbi:MAG: alanine--tRNA ligase [Clostridia bacterium]|nr:alanine--tRNA ligase [Clostridia bacterium]